MYEIENGESTGEITQVKKVKNPRPVEEYLRAQKRFKHLFTMKGGEEEIKKKNKLKNLGNCELD